MPHPGVVGQAGHQDERNRGRGALVAERGQREIAVHLLHVHVAKDQVGQFLAGLLNAHRAVFGFDHVKAPLRQGEVHHLSHPLFVVYDQDSFHLLPAAGSRAGG